MAERILRSPGITTREIDLSAPGRVTPQGIPAGIIGTAQKGPAFVPINFATANDFKNIFGETEGKHFGAMAVNEWMRNARSGVFLRVLGAGDCKKSGTYGSGVTTLAGFYAGQNIRDLARVTSSYATLETDGDADKLVVNPYAGASVASVITNPVTTAGELHDDGVPEVSKLTFTAAAADDVTDVLWDGTYIVVQEANHATNNTFETHVFWLDRQGTRTQTGGVVKDGQLQVADLSVDHASSTWSIVDISDTELGTVNGSAGLHTFAEFLFKIKAAFIAAGLNALGITAGSEPGTDGERELVFTQPHPGVGTLAPQVTNVKTIQVFQHGGTPGHSKITLANTTPGENYVAGTATSFQIHFSSTDAPNVGSSISMAGANGDILKISFGAAAVGGAESGSGPATYSQTIDISSYDPTTDAIATTVASALTTNLAAASFTNDFIPDQAGGGNVTFGAVGDTLTITCTMPADSDTSEVLPLLTIDDNSPNAPAGRVYFLGAQMFQSTSANAGNGIKYFGQGANYNAINANNPRILRGVLLVPSGVVPGLDTHASTPGTFDGDTASAAAYGTFADGQDGGSRAGLIQQNTENFKVILNGFSNSNYESVLDCSFDPRSPIYLSKVLNTDPSKLQEKGHYLYTHYPIDPTIGSVRTYVPATHTNAVANLSEGAFIATGVNTTDAGKFFNTPFASAGTNYTPTYEDWRQKFSHAFTPWIKSQELGNARKKLFRFHMLDAGSGGHAQVKISIANISKSYDLASDFGSFDVLIRSAHDTDVDPIVLQQFSGLNLNPSSDRYIGRVIGDENTFYDFEQNAGKQKLVTEGLYPNNSQYVRVEMHADVENGSIDATALPIGFAGKHHLVLDQKALQDGSDGDTHALLEPPLPMRLNVATGGTGTKRIADSRFHWGVQYQNITDASNMNNSADVSSLVDNLTKWFPSVGQYSAWVGDNAGATNVFNSLTHEVSYDGSTNVNSIDADTYNHNEFSLEKVWVKTSLNPTTGVVDLGQPVDSSMWFEAEYIRDQEADGKNGDGAAYKEVDGATDKTGANGYRYLDVNLDFGSRASKKFFKFTVPFQGGWDGLDIFDPDKLAMNDLSTFREMDSATSATYGAASGSTTAAYRKALDVLAEKSDVDIQLLATPGIRSAGVTDYAIDKTEDRFDALYLMDTIAYDHDIKRVNTSTQETSVTNTVAKLAARNLDSSFAAAYFPDVVIQDGENNVVVPPSVAVLGAMSLNDAVAHPWFAPAGFARGALATTLETAVKLNRSNMDSLYESDINPLTSFPQSGESVVIFGQKTLLQAQSALDRVNVRRLLIDIRRKVRNVSNQILFEPNREATLARFSSLVNPILGRIQAQQGLDRYKVVIDTTTTTQQDVENNTIRGKIFLQPTRSIEFISLDFVVTNAGAEI